MIKKLFTAAFVCPHFILGGLGLLSLAALGAALTSQYVFGLLPCELCLYQRIPYAVIILLSVIGIWATKRMGVKFGAFNILLCAIAFLINSGIAFYHVGVEYQWWVSGCSLGDLSRLDVNDIASSIKHAPAVACDAVPWQLFGISMAGYNVIICAIMGVYALIASVTVTRKANGF